jgi:hypothetical protein
MFAGAASGIQLQLWLKYPHLSKLVRKLNARLAQSGAGKIRFFIIDNEESELASCLKTVVQPNGDKKVIFANGFTPNVAEIVLT